MPPRDRAAFRRTGRKKDIQRLGKKFGDWLQRKHGSLEAAFGAWQNDAVKGDDRAAGIVDFPRDHGDMAGEHRL